MKTTPKPYGRSALAIVQKFYPNVTKVVDATKDLKVEVQSRDISNVNRRKHNKCVFAEVCKREDIADGVVVALKTVYVVHGDTAKRYRQNESTAREIIAYDRGGSFAAGKYVFKAPAAYDKLENIPSKSKSRRDRKNPKFKKAGFRHITAEVRRLEDNA
jgi:hypothetical protein